MEQELYNLINNVDKKELSDEEIRIKSIKRQIYDYKCIVKYMDIYIVEI